MLYLCMCVKYFLIYSNGFDVCFCALSAKSCLICSLLFVLQQGVTALGMASQEGHISVVKLLLEAKAKTDIQAEVISVVMVFLHMGGLSRCV